VELDLDRFTQASASKLASLIEDKPSANGGSARKLEQAFDVIAQHSHGLQASSADEAELHRKIMAIYQSSLSASHGFATLSLTPTNFSVSNAAATLKLNAGKMVNLLPARLRVNPKWMAAGAAAGALGCVAAAALIAPVAIASLPMWSAIGAAVSAAIAPFHSSTVDNAPHESPESLSRVVRSATLLALVLELQGRPEPVITSVLDQTIADDEIQALNSATVRQWLDQVRHRFDIALARETKP
jgi:hypothetical protein